MVVVSADTYNASRLTTVIAAVITSNTSLATMPGNVFLPVTASGLPQDLVVNVTALEMLNRLMDRHAGRAPLSPLREIDRGLRMSLGLWAPHPSSFDNHDGQEKDGQIGDSALASVMTPSGPTALERGMPCAGQTRLNPPSRLARIGDQRLVASANRSAARAELISTGVFQIEAAPPP